MITAGSLAGRVFVVTGAGGTGIASGIVAAITAHGGRVAGIELREDTFPSEAVADGDEGVLRPLADISDADDVRRVSREALDAFGRIDGVVNNAGIGLNKPSYLASEEEFDRIYRVDVRGTWLCCRESVRHCRATGWAGSIVNQCVLGARARHD